MQSANGGFFYVCVCCKWRSFRSNSDLRDAFLQIEIPLTNAFISPGMQRKLMMKSSLNKLTAPCQCIKTDIKLEIADPNQEIFLGKCHYVID